MNATLRPARVGDARALAELIDIAGEGIPSVLWAQSKPADMHVLDYGASRAARSGVNFGWQNATVAEADGAVAGMVLAYRLEAEEIDLDEVPALVRPMLELEALAPESWYLNALAVFPAHQGKGIGDALIASSLADGRRAGCAQASIIVADDNRAARLYERAGFRKTAARPVVGFEGFAHTGDWVLMITDLG